MRIKFFICLRIMTGFVFVASGFVKLMQPYQNFLVTIQSYEILSGAPAVALAKAMPWAEFLVGVFLILGFWSRLSILVLWVFNTVFIGVVSSALIRKLPLQECGCFGDSFSLQPQQTLWMDITLWLIFLWLAACFDVTRCFSLDQYFESSSHASLPLKK